MFNFFKRKSTPKPHKETAKSTSLKSGNYTGLLKEFAVDLKKLSGYPAQSDYREMPSFQKIAALSPDEKADFVLAFSANPPLTTSKGHKNYTWTNVTRTVDPLSMILRRKINFTPDNIITLLHNYKNHKDINFPRWPIGLTVSQLEKCLKNNELTDMQQEALIKVSKWKAFDKRNYYGSDLQKAHAKLVKLISTEDLAAAPYPLSNEGIGQKMKADLDDMPDELRQSWYRLFHIAATSNGSKPSKTYLKNFDTQLETMELSKFKSQMQDWLTAAASANAFQDNNTVNHYNAGALSNIMQTLLKGLVWGLSRFHDEKTLAAVSKLAEKCFNRLPGIGPGAAALGNACIYTLANSKGLGGVAHLSRLKLRVKQNNTQKLIQKHIEEQAQKQGLPATKIEEMAAPDFGLGSGRKDISLKDYTLRISAEGVQNISQTWLKPDGSPQKTTPAFIKDNAALKSKLADVRAQVKEIKKALSTQRDRIDRLYTQDISWTPEDFSKYYLDHGLVSVIARKLIWALTIKGKTINALYIKGNWQDSGGKLIKDQIDTIHLWHPIQSKTDEIMTWRDRLETLEIRQPFKQAYREIYILTDAEINTGTYSNRMAAHIIKQHQFNSLAAIRGWQYSLMGAYDDGRDNTIASKAIPAYNLNAEFWIDEIIEDADHFNEAGIWNYVATDQVRFINEYDDVVELINIPPIVLSEILRDTDLFVGVASIGNDPTWMDRGGAPRTHEYWRSYSFGDLSETAKTRKAVLERLVPRLKIRDKAHIEGKFLHIQGMKHSYKIHIGSGNILIQPDDRYLCIVPGRGKDKTVEALYLPFEGDRGLSIVLSKAFMLAEDNKITDKTILSQLR